MVVAVAVVAVWFQPQKLLIDERVEDAAPGAAVAAPTASPGGSGASTESAPAAGPQDIARGEFVSLDHTTSGAVRVVDVGDGARVVRLEGLATDNGPDLYLYLSTNGADGPEGAFDDEYVSLGRLKGNQGDQNYQLPRDVDLDRYASVVIWCDRFDSAFGAAALA
jgi:hypothetical protein